MLEAILCGLILLGAVFVFIGALGLARLPDFYTRLHGPTKATTLGTGALLLASLIHFSTQGQGISLHEGLVTLFLFITAPVSAHLLAKAALHLRLRSLAPLPAVLTDAAANLDAATVATSPPRAHAGLPATEVTSDYRRGAAAILLYQLEARFGRLAATQRERVEQANLATLRDWSLRLLTADRVEAVFEAPESSPAADAD